MIKKINILLKVSLIFFLSTANVFAELKEELIKKLILTKTLSFDFKQKVEEKEERGSCFIKYPLLMRCNYTNVKEKILISNGRTVAIIKKKYKKIYFYPLKKTPLIIVLDKEKILKFIKNNKPSRIDSDTVVFDFLDKNLGKLKIKFDKNTLNLKGWEIKDAYSNEVNFQMINVKINNQIVDNFFKIPKEDNL